MVLAIKELMEEITVVGDIRLVDQFFVKPKTWLENEEEEEEDKKSDDEEDIEDEEEEEEPADDEGGVDDSESE